MLSRSATCLTCKQNLPSSTQNQLPQNSMTEDAPPAAYHITSQWFIYSLQWTITLTRIFDQVLQHVLSTLQFLGKRWYEASLIGQDEGGVDVLLALTWSYKTRVIMTSKRNLIHAKSSSVYSFSQKSTTRDIGNKILISHFIMTQRNTVIFRLAKVLTIDSIGEMGAFARTSSWWGNLKV